MQKALSHVADVSWRCSCGMRCVCEHIFNLHVEQHDSSIDCSHFSGWPVRHFLTAPNALSAQPGTVARNVHDHSLFLLLRCTSGSAPARHVVAHCQSRCISGKQRVCIMTAVSVSLWQSWTGLQPDTMKDFPPKSGCTGQQLFPAQSSYNILFAVKCDVAADGHAVINSILSDLGDHVENKLLIRGFKFGGGKDLTGFCRQPRACRRCRFVSSCFQQDFGTEPEIRTTA